MFTERHFGYYCSPNAIQEVHLRSSASLDVAISPYCNSVHTTFPRQWWMAWLCVRAQQASNPNRDQISLFLSRLRNGSGGGEKKKKIDIFPLWLSRHKKPSEIWLQHLREASSAAVGNDLTLCSLLPTACSSASFLTTNRLLRIHRATAREYAKQQDCFRL